MRTKRKTIKSSHKSTLDLHGELCNCRSAEGTFLSRSPFLRQRCGYIRSLVPCADMADAWRPSAPLATLDSPHACYDTVQCWTRVDDNKGSHWTGVRDPKLGPYQGQLGDFRAYYIHWSKAIPYFHPLYFFLSNCGPTIYHTIEPVFSFFK
jgi:hypothetical protein